MNNLTIRIADRQGLLRQTLLLVFSLKKTKVTYSDLNSVWYFFLSNKDQSCIITFVLIIHRLVFRYILIFFSFDAAPEEAIGQHPLDQ